MELNIHTIWQTSLKTVKNPEFVGDNDRKYNQKFSYDVLKSTNEVTAHDKQEYKH